MAATAPQRVSTSPGNPLPPAAPAVHRAPAMARPAVDPWHSPAALEALTARKLPISREAWLTLLRRTLEAEGTQGRAAAALGMSLRQFARWIAWLREHDADGFAKLPEMPEGGYRRAEEPAPSKVRKRSQ